MDQFACTSYESSIQENVENFDNQVSVNEPTVGRPALKRGRNELRCKNKLLRIKDYNDLSLNSTATISNLGKEDIEFLFSKTDYKLDKDLDLCEDKLIELCNSKLFDDCFGL